MLNVNLSLLGLGLCGCFLYVFSMSALGRWLARCSDASSVAYIAPPTHGTVRA
jgi:hypothetical protein